ncbi:hypothetical protein OYB53_25555, partial [Escherichia coli]|nr:hypothetical protein [Escherichia coli]
TMQREKPPEWREKQKGSRGIRRGQRYRLVFQFPIREHAISEVKDYLTELYYKKIASKTHSQSNTRFENLSKEELREELARLADEEISRNKAELEYMRSGTFIKDKITKEAETKQDTTEQQKTFKQQPNGWSSLSTTGKIISATGIAIGCAVLGIFGNPFDKRNWD